MFLQSQIPRLILKNDDMKHDLDDDLDPDVSRNSTLRPAFIIYQVGVLMIMFKN